MNYSNLIQYDCANGEGWRTTLFVSGCNLHCEGCFNQEAQDFSYGEKYTQNTHQLIYNYLSDPKISGLSILGGDPLCQNMSGLMSLIDLCQDTHQLNKNVWMWSGITFEQILNGLDNIYVFPYYHYNIARYDLLKNIDVFIDGPFVEELKDPSLKWRGSSNQRIIDVQESLKQNKIILWEQK